MTPKEKAKELVDKYKKASFNCTDCDMPFCDVPCTRLSISEAKECALITVDEILKIIPQNEYMEDRGEFNENRELIYWKEVKQEIEKL